MSVGQTIGLLVIPLLLGVGFFNGVVMLVSPARWFTLPPYIALRGSLREEDYAATRCGRFQIRTLGLILTGGTGWMIVSFFGIPHILGFHPSGEGSFGVPINWWLCVATCVGAIGCGMAMLLKPRWWIAKYFRGVSGGIDQTTLQRILRILSLPVIGIAIYFLLQCADIR
jgi:hypothetical protein